MAGAIGTVTLISFELPTGTRVWESNSVTYDIVAISSNVLIDIKSSTIKADSRGNVSVVIKSSETFDPTKIDPQTLRFGETGQEQSLAFCAKKKQDVNW